MRRHVAFTLIELLVVIGILSMLLTIMLPAFALIIRAAEKAHCRANLKAIGGAIQEYSTEAMSYPATATDDAGARLGNWTGVAADNVASDKERAAYDLFNKNGDRTLSPSASLFLLVRNGSIETGHFKCTADRRGREYKLPTGTERITMTDFGEMANISYSVSYLWNDWETNNVSWPKVSPTAFALMSDLSPVGVSSDADVLSDSMRGNSLNHRQTGQVVLYAAGQVEWRDNNRAGINGDNIFVPINGIVPNSFGGNGSGANPGDDTDTVMCFYRRQ